MSSKRVQRKGWSVGENTKTIWFPILNITLIFWELEEW